MLVHVHVCVCACVHACVRFMDVGESKGQTHLTV